jgi:hypothetical protein
MGEVREIDAQARSFSSHGDIVANFPMTLVTGFILAGSVVSGFLVFLLVKHRSKAGVLTLEQECDRRF